MSGQQVKVSRKQVSKDEQTTTVSDDSSNYSHSSSSGKKCDTDTASKCDKSSSCGNYWPLIIFVILFVIILVAIFACGGHSWASENGHYGFLFGGLFLFFIVWILVLWFFCRAGEMTGAWFFFFLLFAIIFTWFIASVLGHCGESKKDC